MLLESLPDSIQDRIDLQLSNMNRFIPAIKNNDSANEFYARQLSLFWIPFEVKEQEDKNDYENCTIQQRKLIERIVAFFTVADGIVIENINSNFLALAEDEEEARFFRLQAVVEDIHAEVYSKFAKVFRGSVVGVTELVKESIVENFIRDKVTFMLKWMYNDQEEKYMRFAAFACAERILFCTLFTAIFYFRSKNMFNSFIHANEMISRDENIHSEFGWSLVKKELLKMPNLLQRSRAIKRILALVQEVVELEERFAEILLPEAIEDFDAEGLKTYAKFVADDCLAKIEISPIYEVSNPFPWADALDHDKKNNFFDRRWGEYSHTSADRILQGDNITMHQMLNNFKTNPPLKLN